MTTLPDGGKAWFVGISHADQAQAQPQYLGKAGR